MTVPARVWVTRAQPGADRTAERLRALGMEPIVRPLLAVDFLAPPVPDLDAVHALAFTSANGVRAFAALTPRRDRPVFAVGDATAQAAREAGFAQVRSASGDLTALARLIAAEAPAGVLLAPLAETPAGDLAAALAEAGAAEATVRTLAAYRTIVVSPDAPTDVDAVLIHSPRAAQALAAQGPAPARPAVVACISAAAAAPLAGLDLPLVLSPAPEEAALLATLQRALGKRGPGV